MSTTTITSDSAVTSNHSSITPSSILAHISFVSDCFLDSPRCYSQAVFERDDEALETAQRRKPDFAVESCGLKPGDRVLDVGGGWGSFMEHAGRRGIQFTTSQNGDCVCLQPGPLQFPSRPGDVFAVPARNPHDCGQCTSVDRRLWEVRVNPEPVE